MEIFGPLKLLLEEEVEGWGAGSMGAVDHRGAMAFTGTELSFLGTLIGPKDPPTMG